MRKLFSAIFILLLFAACSGSKYTSANFKEKTQQHKRIAVLPFYVNYTGQTPAKLTTKEKSIISEAEGKAFQYALYNNLLQLVNKGELKVNIQPVETTTKRFNNLKPDYTNLSEARIKEICKKLGVDAVVVATVEKERLLYKLEFFGVTIPSVITQKLNWDVDGLNNDLPEIPGNAQRTFDMKTMCMLKNGTDGSLLWRYGVDLNSEWNRPAKEIISELTLKQAKNFPYRNSNSQNN